MTLGSQLDAPGFDAGVELPVSSRIVLGVFDGMGGQQGGQVASRMTRELVRRHLQERDVPDPALDPKPTRDLLSDGLQRANGEVLMSAASRPELSGMGSTATVVVLAHGWTVWGHVGDSRAYMLRGGGLVQLTSDHSFVAHLVETGQISPEEASQHENRHALLRAVGIREVLEVDTGAVRAADGDTLLLCSDGLYGPIGDEGLRAALASAVSAQECCTELVAAANRAGGHDNISAVIARIAA